VGWNVVGANQHPVAWFQRPTTRDSLIDKRTAELESGATEISSRLESTVVVLDELLKIGKLWFQSMREWNSAVLLNVPESSAYELDSKRKHPSLRPERCCIQLIN
jgi:hypothetical protein